MKTFIKIAVLAAAIGWGNDSFAQKKDTLKLDPDSKIKKAAKAVGNKTAETAVKGTSKVTDKTYKDKVGPGGQTIYIDKHAKYYYVNKKGGKVYVTAAQLKNKP
ncbi:hypothetical protein [Hufsiella ginkgonis]|nr:hypothetical protein [Hufsiella ginkgonis]